MEEGLGQKRRVVMGRKLSDGQPVPVVLELTKGGDIAAFRSGVNEAVLFDEAGQRRMITALRDLQAIALRGVTW